MTIRLSFGAMMEYVQSLLGKYLDGYPGLLNRPRDDVYTVSQA